MSKGLKEEKGKSKTDAKAEKKNIFKRILLRRKASKTDGKGTSQAPEEKDHKKRWEQQRATVEKSFERLESLGGSRETFESQFDEANQLAETWKGYEEAADKLQRLDVDVQSKISELREARVECKNKLESVKGHLKTLKDLANETYLTDQQSAYEDAKGLIKEQRYLEAAADLSNLDESLAEMAAVLGEGNEAWDETSARRKELQKEIKALGGAWSQFLQSDLDVAVFLATEQMDYLGAVASIDALENKLERVKQEQAATANLGPQLQPLLTAFDNRCKDETDPLFAQLKQAMLDAAKTQGVTISGDYYGDFGTRYARAKQFRESATITRSIEETKGCLAQGYSILDQLKDELPGAIKDPGASVTEETSHAAEESWLADSVTARGHLEQLEALGHPDFAALQKRFWKVEGLAKKGRFEQVGTDLPGLLTELDEAVKAHTGRLTTLQTELQKQAAAFKGKVDYYHMSKGFDSFFTNDEGAGFRQLPDNFFVGLMQESDEILACAQSGNVTALETASARLAEMEKLWISSEGDPAPFNDIQSRLSVISKQLQGPNVLKFKAGTKAELEVESTRILGLMNQGNTGDAASALGVHEPLVTAAVEDANKLAELAATLAKRLPVINKKFKTLGSELKELAKRKGLKGITGKFFGQVGKKYEQAKGLALGLTQQQLEQAEALLDGVEESLEYTIGYEGPQTAIIVDERMETNNADFQDQQNAEKRKAWALRIGEFKKAPNGLDATIKLLGGMLGGRVGGQKLRIKALKAHLKSVVEAVGANDFEGAERHFKILTSVTGQANEDPLGGKPSKGKGVAAPQARWEQGIKRVRGQVTAMIDGMRKTCKDHSEVDDQVKTAASQFEALLRDSFPDSSEKKLADAVAILDDKHGDLPAKRKTREEVLTIIRSYRRIIDTHPTFKLLIGNPFSRVNLKSLTNALNDLDMNVQRSA